MVLEKFAVSHCSFQYVIFNIYCGHLASVNYSRERLNRARASTCREAPLLDNDFFQPVTTCHPKHLPVSSNPKLLFSPELTSISERRTYCFELQYAVWLCTAH